MSRRWRQRPPGSNWGEFGDDDQLGRLNYLTDENTALAARDPGRQALLHAGLPLDVPATNATNPRRKPPILKPVIRDGFTVFNLDPNFDPGNTGVVGDDAVLLYNQHSSQWDAFAHMGALFDADGDGVAEPIQYNGFSVLDEHGDARFGELGAWHPGIEHMARHCVQGRGGHGEPASTYGFMSHAVSYDDLMRILDTDGVTVEQGDIVCLYTGYADKLLEFGADVAGDLPHTLSRF